MLAIHQSDQMIASPQMTGCANSRHRWLFDPLAGATHGHVERVHPLVRAHKQLDRVLSEIEAYLF